MIIPTYNSEKTLARCLEGVKNQSYRNAETIVVDRYSTDDTPKIGRDMDVTFLQINSERTRAKNIGLKESMGKYVLFLDSDMILSRKVIEECVALFENNHGVGGAVIPERSVGSSIWVKIIDFEKALYAGTHIESARFFNKVVALKAGGYDEAVVFYEESTLPQRIEKLGLKNYRIDSNILHLEEEFRLKSWLMKKLYYGESLRVYAKKYSTYNSDQSSIPRRLRQLLSNRRFYRKPLWLGVIFLKSLEYSFMLIGYFESAI